MILGRIAKKVSNDPTPTVIPTVGEISLKLTAKKSVD